MRNSMLLVVLLVVLAVASHGQLVSTDNAFTDELISQARSMARAVPGDLPRSVHYLAFGDTKAPLSGLVQDGGDEVVTAIYTVFQIRYSHGWIMIDAGVDREAEPDTSVTIRPDRYDRTQQALRGANLILVTHEHHDHVAGVIRPPTSTIVASKTILTRSQVQTLIHQPNVPAVRLAPEAASRYLILDYDRLYPVAPGVVLIKAPGHTPGSQMVFVRQSSGQELLFVGDIVWMMAALERQRQKPEAVSRELGEDRAALQQQIEWLSQVSQRTGVVVVNCHDDNALRSLVGRRILRLDLDLAR